MGWLGSSGCVNTFFSKNSCRAGYGYRSSCEKKPRKLGVPVLYSCSKTIPGYYHVMWCLHTAACPLLRHKLPLNARALPCTVVPLHVVCLFASGFWSTGHWGHWAWLVTTRARHQEKEPSWEHNIVVIHPLPRSKSPFTMQLCSTSTAPFQATLEHEKTSTARSNPPFYM